MNIRPVREEDIEAIINLFRVNYGDDYAIPEFYDPMWVARSHLIEYLLPAFVNEQIEIRTWIESYRRVRSLRKYEFVRMTDGKLLVRGETDWVFVDAQTGSPRAIPEEVIEVFSSAS